MCIRDRMLTGILMPTEGRVKINGFDMREKPMEAKQSMGYIADNPDIFLRLTGLEYVNFIADIYGVSTTERKQRIEQMAERFGMEAVSYTHLDVYKRQVYMWADFCIIPLTIRHVT